MIGYFISQQEEFGMRFVLRYEGPLPSSGDAGEKHKIRKQLHPQLKRQWEADPALKDFAELMDTLPDGSPQSMLQKIIQDFSIKKFHCVPLVLKRLNLVCHLSITFMRHEEPGQLVRQGGDIDNRIKTLFDGLTVPNADQVAKESPEISEDPFYCLLEDDALITGFEVKTERLLAPLASESDVRLLITVVVRPSHVSDHNLQFLGGWL